MAKSSKVRIRFKFNALERVDYRSAKTSTIRAAVNYLRGAVVTYGREELFEEITRFRGEIKQTVEKDLAEYVDRALAFFLTQRSPDTTSQNKRKSFTQKAITFRDDQPYRFIFGSRNIRPSLSRSPNSAFTITWDALAASTIRRKRRKGRDPLRFFYDSGELARVLERRLGNAFKSLLDFDIKVEKDRVNKGERLIKVQAVTSSRLNRAGLAALGGETLGSSGSNKQLVEFLKLRNSAARDKLIEKLDNGGGTRRERPFLQPVLGYWLIRRFPTVFRNAVAEVI